MIRLIIPLFLLPFLVGCGSNRSCCESEWEMVESPIGHDGCCRSEIIDTPGEIVYEMEDVGDCCYTAGSRRRRRNRKADYEKFDQVRRSNAQGFNHQYTEVEGPVLTEVIYDYLPYLRDQKHLHLEHSFAHEKDGSYRVRLDFISQDSLTVETGRFLLVDLVEGFLEKLNNEPRLQEENGGYSFTPYDLEIYITFESFFNHYVDLRYLGFISLRAGLSHFYAADASEPNPVCWHKHGETYYQSLNIATSQRRGERIYKEQFPVPTSYFDRQFIFEELEHTKPTPQQTGGIVP